MTIAHVCCPPDGTIVTLEIADDRLVHVATSRPGPDVSVLVVDGSGERGWARLGDPAAIASLRWTPEGWSTEHVRAVDGVLHYLTLSGDGRWLLGVAYHAGFGAVWPVSTDGSVGEPTDRVEFRNPHSIVERDGHVYLASLGEDLIACYRLTDDGRLEPLTPPRVAAPIGSGPRHLLVAADGRNVYCVTEFSGEVLRLERDPGSGALTLAQRVGAHAEDRGLTLGVINGDPARDHQIWGADVHQMAGALVASERCESTLAVLPMAADGTLSELASITLAEAQPRAFGVSSDGRWLVCAGERSLDAALYRIDGHLLQRLDRREVGRGGQWVTVVG